MIGIVVDPTGDLDGAERVRTAILAAGMVPAADRTARRHARERPARPADVPHRRSVEYDAVLLAGCPAPAPDALPHRDAKAATSVARRWTRG
jgi:catalase